LSKTLKLLLGACLEAACDQLQYSRVITGRHSQ